MKKRQVAIIGGLILLALSFWIRNILSQPEASAKKGGPKTAKVVPVIPVKSGLVSLELRIDGAIKALQRIEVFAEVNGVYRAANKRFEEGVSFSKGELMLLIDDREAQSQYQSARSQFISSLSQLLPDLKLDYPSHYDPWLNYLKSLNAQSSLLSLPSVQDEKLRLFLSGRGIYAAYESAQAAAVRLDKYQLRAPFDGTVTLSTLEVGQLVRAGQKLGEFSAPGDFELAAGLSPEQAALVSIGDSVRLMHERFGTIYGEVFRINERLDPLTQTVQLYVHFRHPELREGEYLKGFIQGPSIPDAFRVNRNLLVDQNQLFYLQDSILRKAPVEILYLGTEEAVVRGLPKNAYLPREKVAGAYPGMPITMQKS